MKLRPRSNQMVIRLLPESESAALNRRKEGLIVAPEKRDTYQTGDHVPDRVRVAEVLAVGHEAARAFEEPPKRVLVNFAAGEPLADEACRVVEPDQLLAVVD